VKELLTDPRFRDFGVTMTRLPDRLLEWCWTQHALRLPLTEVWLGRPDLFLSTIYVTPVVHRIPIVMIAYDLIPLRFPEFYGRDQPLLVARLRQGLQRAAAIIAISDCTKRDFVELLGADPSRVHVIYPGVDDRFTSITDPVAERAVQARYGLRQPYLLYVGSLGPHKNIRRLIQVFRRLKQQHGLPHQLVLCGRAMWGPDAMQEARDLLTSHDCVVLDFIAGLDVPHVYHGAEAFVFPSLYEGFGLPPLEAMACGVPVLVSNAGSLPEVVGEAGLQVPPTDDAAMEHALYRLMTEPLLRETLRERGLRQATRFSWTETARQTLKVFSTVGGGR
jgi:glycosyltransferase involved in cell wall biosynthesis